MQIDIIEHRIFRIGEIPECHMIKIDRSVLYFRYRLFRIADRALLAQHFADALRTLSRECDHDKDHRQHHQTAEDLKTVGEQCGELSDIQRLSVG